MGLSACFVVSGSLGVSKPPCRVKEYFFLPFIKEDTSYRMSEQLSLIRVSFTIALNVLNIHTRVCFIRAIGH